MPTSTSQPIPFPPTETDTWYRFLLLLIVEAGREIAAGQPLCERCAKHLRLVPETMQRLVAAGAAQPDEAETMNAAARALLETGKVAAC